MHIRTICFSMVLMAMSVMACSSPSEESARAHELEGQVQLLKEQLTTERSRVDREVKAEKAKLAEEMAEEKVDIARKAHAAIRKDIAETERIMREDDLKMSYVGNFQAYLKELRGDSATDKEPREPIKKPKVRRIHPPRQGDPWCGKPGHDPCDAPSKSFCVMASNGT